MISSNHISRRSFLRLIAAGGVSALVMACGKRSSGNKIQPLIPPEEMGSNPLPGTTPSIPPLITQGTPPANTKLPPKWTRGKVPRERTLVFNGEGTDYPDCNPFHWGGRLLEGFAYYSAVADKTTLWLLESYQYSADATELTLKFRAGIEWSDGKAYSTRDAKFGFETAIRLGWAEVIGVEAVDDLTLRVKLTKSDWRFFFRNLVYGLWQGKPQLIVPEHIFSHFTDQQVQYNPSTDPQLQDKIYTFFDPEKNYPIVTGPYMMVETDPAILREFNYVDLNMYDLRPDWWAVKTSLVEKMPEVERVITVVLENSLEMQVKQFTDNLVDLCDSYLVDPDAIRSILTQASHVSTWTGDKPPYGHVSYRVGGLGFNCQQAPFDDPRVRWAIADAIDQRDLLDSVYGRDVEAAISPFPEFPAFQKLMEGIEDLASEYNFLVYDPIKSAQLMQESGFKKDAAGYWADRYGARVKMTLNADGPNTWFYAGSFGKLADKLAEQLRQAGFDCPVKLFEDNPQNMADQGSTEMIDTWDSAAKGLAPMFILGSLGVGINDPIDQFITYRQDLTNQGYDSNITRWVDESFIQATAELEIISPEDPRTEAAFRKCMEIWYKNLPFIPLCQTYNRVPYNTRFWTNWPSAENPYCEVGFTYRSSLMLVINLKAQL
jgi:peptide/nickel transport system substrate-binding protein